MTSVPSAPHPSPPDDPERPAAVERRDLPAWPAWAPLAALVAAFAGASVFALVFAGVGGAFGSSVDDPPPAVNIASIVAQDLCLIGAALGFAALSGALPRPWQFGFERVQRLGPAIGAVVGAYVLFIAFSAAWLALIGQSQAEDEIAEDLGADESTLALIGVTFVVTVCAPIAEEVFFRGYTFGTLRRFGLWPAAALTGLLFGLVHITGSPIAFLLPLAVFGAALCLVREYTGSLYPCMALHCANNSFAMASNESWDWQIPVVLVASLACIAGLVWLMLRFWPAGKRRPPGPAAAPAPA